MKKQIIAGLLAATALVTFGCSGRNAEFGVVDMREVESRAEIVQTVREEVQTKAQQLQEEANAALEGKTGEEAQQIREDYSSRMSVVNSEAQNKLKASLDMALNEVAKEKGLGAVLIKDAVPQGGVDVTEDVIAKMK